MSTLTQLTKFLPSIHGWAFGNFGGFGNCGGMCWAALDCFYLKQTIARTLTKPSQKLKDKISGRQKDTMDDWLWAKVVDWTQRPDQSHISRAHSVGHLTQEEWPKIKNLLDHGEPATLCVIREEGYTANPTMNHQVLAWGYNYDSTQKHVTIRVYDSNYPHPQCLDANKMTLEIDLDRPHSNIHGKQLLNGRDIGVRMRGFFLIPYDKDVNVHVHKIDSNGTVGERVDQRAWHKGWTTAEFYTIGAKTYLFLLKEKGYGSDDKNVHIHTINPDGTVGARVTNGSYKWSEGWTAAEFYTIGAKTYLFLLKEKGYGSDDKNVHIHTINPDGSVGARVTNGSYKWSEGWTAAEFYTIGAKTYLFLLKEKGYGSDDKNVHIHTINPDGTVGACVTNGSYKWSEGWTAAEFYTIGAKTYLFLLKEKGYGSDDKNVHIHTINPDGTVGARVTNGSYKWSEGWTQTQPYVVGGVPYLFLLKNGDGVVHIHRLNNDGTVGERIKDYNWSEGWTSVELNSDQSGTYIILLKDTQKSDNWLDIPYI